MPPHWLGVSPLPRSSAGGMATARGDSITLPAPPALQQVWQQVLLPCPTPLPHPGTPFRRTHRRTQRGLGDSNLVMADMLEQKNVRYLPSNMWQKKYNAYIKPSRSKAQELPVRSGLPNFTVHISSPPSMEGELAPSWAVTSVDSSAFLLLST